MKVAFLLNKIPVISETFIMDMIVGLQNRSHEVIALYERVKPNDQQCQTTHPVSKPPDEVFYWIGGGNLRSKIKQMNYRAFYLLNNFNSIIKERDKAKSDGYLSANFQLFSKQCIAYHVLCKYRPDVLFAHYGYVGNYHLFLKDHFNVPMATFFHGIDLQKYPQQNPGVYNRLFATTEMMITQSNFGKEKLISLGCPPEKISVVPYGTIPLEQPIEKKVEAQKRRRLIILSIARLTEKKGLEFGIRALAKIRKEKPGLDFEYRVIGEGELREQITNLLDKIGLKERCTLLGALSRKEIQKELLNADIFMLPSVTSAEGDTEGSPVAILEAQNHSLPVVSSYHAGIPETVIDGKTAFLCPEKDVDCLSKRLQTLLENTRLRLEMGLAGWHHIKQNFDQQKLIKMLDENLQNIAIQYKSGELRSNL
jgi:colanic acid/amylovoran biosynthesis glycosyltransferase